MLWQKIQVKSPHLPASVPVLAALDVPYFPNANRFQTVNLYAPDTAETERLVGAPAVALPGVDPAAQSPTCHVHIHGGAWRDPQLTASSVEAAVAHAFADGANQSPIRAIASINYTVSPFPTHPSLPYDAIKDNHSDPSRDAVHPQHLSDVLHGLALLQSFGLAPRSYVLSGHSAGACLAFQAILKAPAAYGLSDVPEAPCPAAIVGLNGLYDLLNLVYALGASHSHLRADYDMFLSNAFGREKSGWPAASPARFDPADLSKRIQAGQAPSLILLDESAGDQLVPMNQLEQLWANLSASQALRLVRGKRCTGEHAAPWESGIMLWESVLDALAAIPA